MNFARLSVHKPVLVTMLVLTFVVLGIYSYLYLAVDLFPKIEFPYVTVRTVYPGAGPVEIENLVSRPIEEEVGAINGVKNIISTSMEGLSFVIVEFQLETDIDVAAMDVKDKVSAVREKLPKDILEPVILKLDMGAMPVINLAISSPRPLEDVYRLTYDVIKPELSKVAGLASIEIVGGKEREILVGVQRDRLQAYGMSIMDVVYALMGENIELPSGHITEPRREYPIRVAGQFKTVDEIRQIQLLSNEKESSPIRLQDVANVVDTFEEQREKARFNKKTAVGLSLVKRPDANVIQVVSDVMIELERVKKLIPEDYIIQVSQDRSRFIKSSISNVLSNMGIGILLTSLVLFLFLHNWKTTIIAALSMPSSVIATFLLVKFAGFTINMMSLTALAISIGMLVTNSIVVIEDIIRHKDLGESAEEAAERGTSEIAVAVAASSLTNVVVFTPIAFMSGIIGRFFMQFGLTVTFATFFSLLISFTMVPMLAALVLKERPKSTNHNHARFIILVVLSAVLSILILGGMVSLGWLLLPFGTMGKIFIPMVAAIGIILVMFKWLFKYSLDELTQKWWFKVFSFIFWIVVGIAAVSLVFLLLQYLFGTIPGIILTVLFIVLLLIDRYYGIFKRFADLWERTYGKLQNSYDHSLNWSLDHKATVLFIVAIFFFGSLYIFQFVGSEFFGNADQGMFQVTIEMPAGTNLEQTNKAVSQVEDILTNQPYIKYLYAEVGRQSGGIAMFSGQGVHLGQVMVELVSKTERPVSTTEFIQQLRPKLTNIPAASINVIESGMGGGGEKDINIEVTGTELEQLNKIADQVMELTLNTSGTSDVDKSYRSGVPEVEILPDRRKLADHGISASMLASALRTSIEGNIDSKFRVGNKEYNIRVRFDDPYREYSRQVEDIKLKTGDYYVPITEVASVKQGEGPIQISRKNKKRMVTVTASAVNRSMGEIVNELRQKVAEKINLPPGYQVYFGGQTEEMERSFNELTRALVLSIILTWMLLAAILESYLHPITIMVTLPLGLIGVIMALLISGKTINILSFMAIIMLVGIVVNNAILQIDYIQILRGEGKKLRDAILEACVVRMRPIIMTNLAAIISMLPLALAMAEGSEMQSPIAIVSIGGFITSTIFTLFVIPIIFSAFESIKAKGRT